MRKSKKLIFLFLTISILRIIPGCCSCEDEFYSFNYTALKIHNIDNSGQWSKPSELNNMPSNGVAFEISILGSEPTISNQSKLQSLGFNSLSAQSCNCEELYVPTQTITDIRILTVESINDDYCCNDDVTNLFLANTCVSCEDIGNFYVTMDELISRINPESFYHLPTNKFLIYLNIPVENTTAQFQFEIMLSNGESLFAETALISIL